MVWGKLEWIWGLGLSTFSRPEEFGLALLGDTSVGSSVYQLYAAGQGYAEGMSRRSWNPRLPGACLDLCTLCGEVAVAPSGSKVLLLLLMPLPLDPKVLPHRRQTLASIETAASLW